MGPFADAIEVGDLATIRRLCEQYRSEWDAEDYEVEISGGLAHAAFHGQPEAAKFLIELGADIDDDYSNPLINGVSRGIPGSTTIATILIEHGANVNVTDDAGKTPLHLVIWKVLKDDNTDADKERFMRLARLLIAKGADVNAHAAEGDTPLHLTVSNPGQSFSPARLAAALLLESGADINVISDGLTPLHIAAMWGQLNMVTFLLEHGADKNLQNDVGQTAQQLALLKGGGGPPFPGPDGQPPQYEEVARLLEMYKPVAKLSEMCEPVAEAKKSIWRLWRR